MNHLSRILRIGGVLFLAGGIQYLAFQGYITPQIDKAGASLALLQQEVPGNHLLDATLEALRDYRRISTDEVRRRQALQLRQDFIQAFPENPRLAIDEFARAVAGFEAQSAVEEELLAALADNLSILADMYSDHFAAALANYTSPPFYYQPAAAFITWRSSNGQRLEFDHALYLMLTGDRGTANAIFNQLRESTDSDEFRSRILFAQSRLQFDAYQVEQDPEYHRQAVQYAQQSLRHDAAYEQPKLFLEYLLTIDLQAVEAEGTPREGQGSGESEGERGAISADLPEH